MAIEVRERDEFGNLLPPVKKFEGQTDKEKVAILEQENRLLRAQNEALTDKSNFHDAVLTEIILAINS